MKPKRIYLDFAASTPTDPAVVKAMMPYFTEEFGNPGSLHSFGQEAQGAVDKARESVAKAIGADFREVIFTGSATEANNLVLRGVTGAARPIRPKIIISSIEHESILDTARDLEKDACLRRQGVEMVYIPVDKKGIVDIEKIKDALDGRTTLVSVMYVNNEIGSIQPIQEISRLIKNSGGHALLHTDAAQAFNYFDCNVKKLGVDLMTLSGQKIYGPKGIGALYVGKSAQEKLKPIVTGGGQEFGLRSGTENVAAIVGFGKAVELAEKSRSKNTKEVKALKDYFWRGLKKFYPQAEMNGDSKAPHILNVYFPTEYAGDLLVKLDIAGVAASAGSACSARSYAPSPVLQALGLSQERVRGSLRFSFGKTLKTEDMKRALKQIEGVIR
ncbi:MAG: cysteine desulfurase family protein [Minisyncoccia bacterium]|jgi:cysteine desulfurase